MTIIPVILLILTALALFVLSPSPRRRRMEAWKGTAFAHRGLHGDGVCENTLAAFERACSAGFAIELDVRLSRDGEVMVFHDDTLLRLLGDARRVDSADAHQLQEMRLPGGEHIPTLSQVLELVNGRVPLLVEVKNGKRNAELCRKTLKQLQAYRGEYLVESFNPLIVMWFRRHARHILRGQLVSAQASYMPQFGRTAALLLSGLCLNFLARPDFIAYDVNFDTLAPRLQKFLFRTPMACWTVKTRERFDAALQANEMPIFEDFLPEQKRA